MTTRGSSTVPGKRDELGNPLCARTACRLAYVSRTGYHRWQCAPPAVDADLDLRDEIQHIALEFPSYGWLRMTVELKRRGWEANH